MKKNTKRVWTRMSLFIGVLGLLSFPACNGVEDNNEVDTEAVELGDEGLVENEGIVEDEGVVEDDGVFDSNEFYTSFNAEDEFEDWDTNNDNFLDENEFYDSNYDLWDTDDDGILEENEWNDDVANFGLTDEDWDTWDVNNDNQVDENEFETAFGDNGYYSAWDADRNNQLTEREYTDGIFGLWDDNDDGLLEKERYDSYYNTYFGV